MGSSPGPLGYGYRSPYHLTQIYTQLVYGGLPGVPRQWYSGEWFGGSVVVINISRMAIGRQYVHVFSSFQQRCANCI